MAKYVLYFGVHQFHFRTPTVPKIRTYSSRYFRIAWLVLKGPPFSVCVRQSNFGDNTLIDEFFTNDWLFGTAYQKDFKLCPTSIP